MGCAGSKAPHQPFEDETTAPPPARNADGGDVVPESYVVSESIEPTMTRKSSHAEISMQFGADDYSGMRTFDVGGGAVKPSDNPAHVAHRTATRRASYEPDLPPMPDSFLDRYKLGETLGSGSFSIVRACTRRADGGQFAVKVMDTSDWEDSDMDDLMEECRNLTELEHPNIVQIVEMVQEANMVYLVTERCVGGELVDRIIERSHFSETDARDTVLLVLKAVHFCHERDVVHRDLKLENVLLTSTATQSSVKLVDFGFSKKIQDGASGTLETPCGTLRFCAPEILSNQSYGKKVDVWGIGCIAFCLLCGFPPFYDDNDAALTRKIQRGEFDFDAEVWDSVSDLGKEVVTWMLTVDPAGRPTSADLLQHNWFTAAEITGADPAGLLDSVRNLRSMVARRKFRAAVKAVVAMNRMRSLSNFGSAAETAAAVATVSASAGATSDDISTGASTDSAESGGGLSPRKEKEKERRLSVDLGLSPEQAQDIFVIQEQVGVTPRRALEAYRAHGEDLTETVMSLFDEGEMERTAAASPSPVAAALPQGGGGECSDVESLGGATSQHHDGEQQSSTQMPPALIMTAAKGKSTTRVTLEVCAPWTNGRVGIAVTDADNAITAATDFHDVQDSAITVGQLIANAFPPDAFPPGAPGTPMKPRLRGKLLDESAVLHEIGCANGDAICLTKRNAVRRPSLKSIEVASTSAKRPSRKGSNSKYAISAAAPAPVPDILPLPVVGSLVRKAPELQLS